MGHQESPSAYVAVPWLCAAIIVVAIAPMGAAGGAVAQGQSKGPVPSLDGIWQSRGYGSVMQISGTNVRQWDVNSLGCRARPDPETLSRVFANQHLDDGGRVLEATSASNITVFHYDRLNSLPADCLHPRTPTRDPVVVFDEFWQIFAEQYAFFHERGIDWQSMRARYRPRINPASTEADLYAVLRDMLSATNDLHVSLETPNKSFIPALTSFMFDLWSQYDRLTDPRPDLEKFLKQRSRAYLQPVLDRYLDPGRTTVIEDNVMTGSLRNGEVGYIQVLGESGFIGQPEAEYRLDHDVEAARRVFDQAFAAVSEAKALILDLRINYGGQDTISLQMAGRLAAQTGPGFSKCARSGDGFIAAQKTTVSVFRPGFSGWVIILTSAHTISAGDEFLMIGKDYPHVIVVGDTSAGVYSDPLHKPLPNGWSIGVSNERYVAPDGRLYEGQGILPDVRVGFNPEMMAKDGRDPILEKALDVLDVVRTHGRAALPKAPAPPSPPVTCGTAPERRL